LHRAGMKVECGLAVVTKSEQRWRCAVRLVCSESKEIVSECQGCNVGEEERVEISRAGVRAVIAGALVLVVAAMAVAQSAVPAKVAAGYQTIRESDLHADLGFIASDALQGRMSLTTGDEVAVQWIAAEFAKVGLKPAFGNSYLQPVPLIEYRADRAQSYMTVKQGSGEKKLQYPDVSGAFKRDVDVSGDVVFAGFGITAPELGYDDYKGVDAHGKVVLVFDHEPQETDAASIFNGTGNTRYATIRVKALNAQAHGAVAMLVVAEPNRKHLSNQERIARIGGSATRKVPASVSSAGGR